MVTSRVLTPSLFAAAAILFLLPFFTVSCTGPLARELRAVGAEPSDLRLELTGSDLLFGRVPERLEGLEKPGTPHLMAIALEAAVAAGIMLSAIPGRLGGAAGAVLGVSGLTVLFLLSRAADEEARAAVQPNAREFVDVTWEFGSWAVGAALIAGALQGALRALRAPVEQRPSPSS